MLFFSVWNVKLEVHIGFTFFYLLFFINFNIGLSLFNPDGWNGLDGTSCKAPATVGSTCLVQPFWIFCLCFHTIPFLIIYLHNPSLLVLLTQCYEAVKETYGRRCRMHGRRTGRTDRSYGIRWRERNTEKRRRCGTYNAGVKDLASAYVLCPRLAECGGLSIYERNGVYGTMKGSWVGLWGR